MGRNGSGKSTLLKQIVGLIKPGEGQVTVAGLDTRKAELDDIIKTRRLRAAAPGRAVVRRHAGGGAGLHPPRARHAGRSCGGSSVARTARLGRTGGQEPARPQRRRATARSARRLENAINKFKRLDGKAGADGEDLHRLRLATKTLRYGFEPLAPLEPELKPVLAELTALQRALGRAPRLDSSGRSRARGAVAALSRSRRWSRHAATTLAARPRQMKETESLADGRLDGAAT